MSQISSFHWPHNVPQAILLTLGDFSFCVFYFSKIWFKNFSRQSVTRLSFPHYYSPEFSWTRSIKASFLTPQKPQCKHNSIDNFNSIVNSLEVLRFQSLLSTASSFFFDILDQVDNINNNNIHQQHQLYYCHAVRFSLFWPPRFYFLRFWSSFISKAY